MASSSAHSIRGTRSSISNIPATVTNGSTGPGVVLTISEHAPFHVERVFSIDTSTGYRPARSCGRSVQPDGTGMWWHQLVDHCQYERETGCDRSEGRRHRRSLVRPCQQSVLFRPLDAGVLGVENAGPPPTAVTPDTPTAVGSHSVAADPNQKRVFVPIRSSTFTPGATICGSKGGTDTFGCIAVYDSP
jgi:hypothetical protein